VRVAGLSPEFPAPPWVYQYSPDAANAPVTLFYLDSSAWLKRYFLEPGSGWMTRLFESGNPLASSVLGYAATHLIRSSMRRNRSNSRIGRLTRASVSHVNCGAATRR